MGTETTFDRWLREASGYNRQYTLREPSPAPPRLFSRTRPTTFAESDNQAIRIADQVPYTETEYRRARASRLEGCGCYSCVERGRALDRQEAEARQRSEERARQYEEDIQRIRRDYNRNETFPRPAPPLRPAPDLPPQRIRVEPSVDWNDLIEQPPLRAPGPSPVPDLLESAPRTYEVLWHWQASRPVHYNNRDRLQVNSEGDTLIETVRRALAHMYAPMRRPGQTVREISIVSITEVET
jgi:hypothetical protein